MKNLYTPPPLPDHCGSWAIVPIDGGNAVAEMWSDSQAIRHIDASKYKAVPICEYLASLSTDQRTAIDWQLERTDSLHGERVGAIAAQQVLEGLN